MMPKKAIYLAAFFLFLFLPSIQAQDIGCEKHNATVLRCWNQGSIEPVTYYRVTDRGLQFCNNNTDRFNWTTYRHGFLYYNAVGSPILVDYMDLGLEFKLYTDNQTFYALLWNKTVSIGGKTAYVEYRAQQLLNDDYVNFTMRLRTISGFTAWNKTVSMYRAMIGSDIDNDGDVDVINFVNESHDTVGLWLNLTAPLSYNSSEGWLSIGDLGGLPTSNIVWAWKDARPREIWIRPGAGINNNVYWLRLSQNPIKDNRTYELSEYWIDADVCNKACGPGITYGFTRVQCVNTGSISNCSADANNNVELRFRLYFLTFFTPGVCSYGSGCYVEGYDNSSTPFYNPTSRNSSSDPYLVCETASKTECKQDNIARDGLKSESITRKFNVTCRSYYQYWDEWCYFIYETDYCSNLMTLICNPETNPPNTTLWLPLNNSVHYENETFIFRINASDDTSLRNITLWANFSGTWQPNQSLDVTPDPEYSTAFYVYNLSEGIYVWNGEACDTFNNCAFNDTNFTFSVIPVPAPTPLTPEEEPDDFIAIMSLCAIILVAILVFINQVKKNGRKRESNQEGRGS